MRNLIVAEDEAPGNEGPLALARLEVPGDSGTAGSR